jgi:hypothetical protein
LKPSVSTFAGGETQQVFNIFSTHDWVQPHESPTTAKYQYRIAGSGEEFHSTPGQFLGETSQFAQIRINGLLPHTKYEYQLSATNSLGTTLGGIRTSTTRSWGIQAGGTLPATNGSGGGGALSVNWQFGAQKVSWTCSEWVQGQLGNATAASDNYTLHFEGCKMAYNGVNACNLESFNINLGGNLEAQGENKFVNLKFPAGCQSPFGASATFTISQPFEAQVPVGEGLFAVQQPMNLSSSMTFGGNVGSVSISGDNWALTGANSGKKFGSL